MAKVLKLDWEQPDPTSIEMIRSIVTAGGVIAYPTDTFYGLGADPFNREAVSRIFKIKQRPADKPLLILIHSLNQLNNLTHGVTDNARQLMEHFWPGPLTLIFKAAPGLPDTLTAGTGTVGIRLPDHVFSRRLLEELGQPLTAPSANTSGRPEPTTARQVENDLGEVGCIIDGGPTAGGQPSTVLDTTTDPPTLRREGAVSRTDLEAILPIQTP